MCLRRGNGDPNGIGNRFLNAIADTGCSSTGDRWLETCEGPCREALMVPAPAGSAPSKRSSLDPGRDETGWAQAPSASGVRVMNPLVGHRGGPSEQVSGGGRGEAWL